MVVRTEKGKILHEKGITLPVSRRDRDDGRTYAASLAAALRVELEGTRAAAKTVMRWTGAGERTVKTWLGEISGPSGEHLISLMRHSDAVFAVVLSLSDRTPIGVADDLALVRQHLLDAMAALEDRIDRENVTSHEITTPPGNAGLPANG